MRLATVFLLVLASLLPATNASPSDRNNNGIEGDEAQYVPGAYAGPKTMSQTVVFPLADDTWDVAAYPYWWHAGDSVTGTRALGLESVGHAEIHLVIDENYLSPPNGHVALSFLLGEDRLEAGFLDVLPSQYVVDASFDFYYPVALGGSIQVWYQEFNDVAPGYGSVVLNDSGASTITFAIQSTPVEGSTWGNLKSLYK